VGLSDTIALLLVLAKAVMMIVAVVFFVSGVDDMFIDLCYFARGAYRRFFTVSKCPRLKEEDLLNKEEQPIAVMIPAWDESAVIRPMLENALRRVNYSNYVIFVGTYPNDPSTHSEVDKVREHCDRVERIVTGHDGPTNKADCLNWIYHGIRLYEKQNQVEFQIFVMQDCEDVIHPLCYKLFNYLMPEKDMVQLPVLSLERKWYEFTAGHYLDEFAQLHYKDLVVRELLDGSIPAAGVGCAFSRRTFAVIASDRRNQVFSIDSLTEDYDFGLRLKQRGLNQAFVKFNTVRTVRKTGASKVGPGEKSVNELIGIREYFPANFRAAVRQKSRWVIGIALQGWASLGWKGDLSTKYMLYRDRKSLITNIANMAGYLVVLMVLSLWLTLWLVPDSYRFPSLLEKGSWLWYLLLANTWLLGLRLFQRAYCVQRLYGFRQAILSLPRTVWGNVVNFSATLRAIRLYLRYLRTGKLIAWDKTAHSYPSEDELLGSPATGDSLPETALATASQSMRSTNIAGANEVAGCSLRTQVAP
jgi:bacteriophage N4 adsorption protein B